MKYFLSILVLYLIGSFCKAQSQQELLYSTYIGGESTDLIYKITSGTNENIYTVGSTLSLNNISSPGAYQEAYGGGSNDGFIFAFDSDYNLLWSTYFGGEEGDVITSVTELSDQSIVVAGYTSSLNNISTVGSQQENNGGYIDAFISKLSSNGDMIWSSYFGGDFGEQAYSLVSDSFDNIYVVGSTGSDSLATESVYQDSIGGLSDGFITKYNSDGELQWTTYYGGEGFDYFVDATINNGNELCLVGFTQSSNNISSIDAYQVDYQGEWDTFITKFDLNGNRLWGSYFGGSGYDEPYCISTDENNNIIISGYTESENSIATPGAHKTVNENDAFLASFTSEGLINWGTYFGGEGLEDLNNTTTIIGSDIYFSGRTSSNDGITLGLPYQSESAIPDVPDYYNFPDMYLVKFNSSGEQVWGTYYGADEKDAAYSICILDSNTLAIAGLTKSTEGLVTDDAFQSNFAGLTDGIFAVFDVDIEVGIEEYNRKTLSIYPNPSNDYLIIDLPDAIEVIGKIEIYTMDGKLKYTTDSYSSGSILWLNLNSGLYMLCFYDGNEMYYGKFIVQ